MTYTIERIGEAGLFGIFDTEEDANTYGEAQDWVANEWRIVPLDPITPGRREDYVCVGCAEELGTGEGCAICAAEPSWDFYVAHDGLWTMTAGVDNNSINEQPRS